MLNAKKYESIIVETACCTLCLIFLLYFFQVRKHLLIFDISYCVQSNIFWTNRLNLNYCARKLWKEKKVSYSRPDVCNWQRWLNNRSWVDIFRREMFKWIRIDSSDAVLVASHSRDVGRSKNLGAPKQSKVFWRKGFCFVQDDLLKGIGNKTVRKWLKKLQILFPYVNFL